MNNNGNHNAGASQSKPSTGQSSSKTTAMSSVSNAFLQVTELQLAKSLVKNITDLVLCTTALRYNIETNSQGHSNRGGY